MNGPDRRPGGPQPSGRPNWTLIALIAAVAFLVLIVAYFATRGNSNQDKLTNAELAQSAPQPSRAKLCASSTTYDFIKRELFRRAAQLRGSDQAAYDRVSAAAVVRMDNPVMESEDTSTGAVNCSGSLSLDLPPGVTAGGRTTLMSDVDYSVQQAADGSGMAVVLRNAEAIITPLSTLAQVTQPPPQTDVNEIAPESPDENQTAPEADQPATPPPQSVQLPCANPRTRGDSAVCSDPGLSALDRNVAAEYGRAFAVATPEQRAQLRQTAQRFSAYRSRCPDRQCIASAYAGRLREIRDIIEGRWQPAD
jgi:hypothetical protein